MKDGLKRTPLITEEDLYNRVLTEAEGQHRSLNGQLNYIIAAYFDLPALQKRVRELQEEGNWILRKG